jgi:hypothetical protein
MPNVSFGDRMGPCVYLPRRRGYWVAASAWQAWTSDDRAESRPTGHFGVAGDQDSVGGGERPMLVVVKGIAGRLFSKISGCGLDISTSRSVE